MNKAITDGLMLMPPPFSAGLNLWSQGDGTPGSASYAGQPNAVYVPSDQDFAGCMELQKTAATQKVRSYQQTPIQPGLYLRVTARVKAISGNLPTVRVAGWAGSITNTNVAGVPQTGPEVTLTSYGEVVTVTAIIGTGNRQGVNMIWVTTPVYGFFGIDLTGPTGGVVRIDDITIDDVTNVFYRKLMDWVDVRDYGAIGNGVADDSAAFTAADTDAQGRGVLVSKGTYYLGSNVTINNPARFEGTVTMPGSARLALTRNYDIDAYQAAFGGEEEGFRRALQALFYFSDHAALDLLGRRVILSAPVDVAAVAGLTTLTQRRLLVNGVIEAGNTTGWDTQTVTSVATYTPSANNLQLTGVANVANVPVGARISGTGVGREIYVRSKNVGAGTIELNLPLWGAAGTRTFTFERYKYLLDFSGFSNLGRFEFATLGFECNGRASALMLPSAGVANLIRECAFNKPKDRAITSVGTGCQGLQVDTCQFLSNEQGVPAQNRTSICLNVNSNDPKIRNNRIVRFAHFAILASAGNIISGNHFFQGDDQTAGVRRAGIVFTTTNIRTTVTSNYIDNCFIEWSNEHDSAPEFSNEFSFGGLSVTANHFMASDVAPSFRWIIVTPYGPGHFINGFTMRDNVFRCVNATVDRVDAVDTTYATLDYSRFRNLLIEANPVNSVSQPTQTPVMIEHNQNTAADTWVVDASAYLPFGARARNVQSIVHEGAIVNGSNVAQAAAPYVEVEQGTGGGFVNLRWPTAVKGRVHVTIRCDNPN